MKAPAKYTFVDYLFQFITITVGVLIALLINGLVEWNNNRQLVEQARTTIRLEIEANLKEMEGFPGNVTRTASALGMASQFADELLATGKTNVRSLQLGFNLATLNSSGWQTAERTGALAHMDYDEVQEYSELYAMQRLFDEQARKAIDLVASSTSLMASGLDPTTANADDLKVFRQHVRLLQSNLMVTQQLGDQLMKGYQEFLKK